MNVSMDLFTYPLNETLKSLTFYWHYLFYSIILRNLPNIYNLTMAYNKDDKNYVNALSSYGEINIFISFLKFKL